MGRILVIDSADGIRQLIVRVLRQAGLDAVGVHTTADALAACAPGAAPPDLILAVCHDPTPAAVLGTLLPLRSDPATAGVPLVVAADDREVIAQAQSLGARDCLIRAWLNVDVLVDCVRQNLRG